MVKKGRSFPFASSTRSLQENVTRSAPAAVAAYALIGAIILFGAIGYGLDRWLGTDPWLLLTGLMAGMIVGFYELVKTAWHK